MATMITLARIGLILPFAAMFFVNAAWAMPVALALFSIAAVSDFLDGYVARKRGEVSALGVALDPLADKLLIGAAILLLVRNGVIRDAAFVAALAILMREILVGGLREALGARGATLPVTQLAKWKTTAQLVAVSLLLAAAPGGVFGAGLAPAANAALWFAAILTVITGAQYARQSVRLLRRHAE